MFSSVPDVLNVAAVCGLFFLIFSIFGVSMFKGQLRDCQGDWFEESISGSIAEDYLINPVTWSEVEAGSDLQNVFAPDSAFLKGGADNVGECDFPNEPCCVADAGSDLEYVGERAKRASCYT